MPPLYTVAVTAFAVGVSEKWLDNLLSHGDLPGIVREKQGVARIITERGALAIELVRILNVELGMPMAECQAVVRSALSAQNGAEPTFQTASGVELRFPAESIAASLRDRLRDAVEAVPPRKRGRPPGKKKNAER